MDNATDRSLDSIKGELKELLIRELSLEDITAAQIGDDVPLFGEEGLGLDSLDGVEIVVILQRTYGLDIKDLQKGREIFQSVNTLAAYVQQNLKK